MEGISRRQRDEERAAQFRRVRVTITDDGVRPVEDIEARPGELVLWQIVNKTNDPVTVTLERFERLDGDRTSSSEHFSLHPLEGDIEPSTKLRKRKSGVDGRVTYVAASIKDDLPAPARYKYNVNVAGRFVLDPEIIVF
jgi:hypothetical protein